MVVSNCHGYLEGSWIVSMVFESFLRVFHGAPVCSSLLSYHLTAYLCLNDKGMIHIES